MIPQITAPHQAPCRDPIPALRAEVAATQAKLDRLRAALTIRQTKLHRLLALEVIDGSHASARPRHE
jgi:hypothetical protein